MDNTETNIRMCKEAVEIQSEWIPSWGDKLSYTHSTKILMVASSWTESPSITKDRVGTEWCKLHRGSCTWLPRQDQLQEMVKYFKGLASTEYSARGLLLVFWEFVDSNWIDYLWTLSDEAVSMEQLWLAFVMKEKFNKIWDGEKWVEEQSIE